MNVSFQPLRADAMTFISERVGIDFSYGIPFDPVRWFCVTARDDEGHIMGVILCEYVTWFEAHFNSAVANPRCATKRLLRATYKALFMRNKRLTAFIDVTNKRAIRNAISMGFVYEGFCRLGINGARDAYTFGMLKEDCRMLRPVGGRKRVQGLQDRRVSSHG